MLNSSAYSKTWLSDLASVVDVNAFVKSLAFEAKLTNCHVSKMNDSLIGVELHHQDLFLFTESTRKKGYVSFMDTDILQSNNDDSQFGDLGDILGTGTNRKKSGKQYINVLELPVLGMMTEALGLDGIACFHPTKKVFFYSTSIDPTATDFVQYKMLLDVMSLYTINGIMSMIFDCIAYEGYSKISNKTSSSAKYLENTIDAFPHSFGCTGGMALGAANHSVSPLVNGLIGSITELKILARTGYVIMQSKRSILSSEKVTCSQVPGPFIKTEFVPQMIKPVASKQFELGITPAEWASFRDDQSTKGDTVIAWWVRKDFIAFSGKCAW